MFILYFVLGCLVFTYIYSADDPIRFTSSLSLSAADGMEMEKTRAK